MKKSAATLAAALLTTQAGATVIGDKDWMQVYLTEGSSLGQMKAIFNEQGQCDVAGCILYRSQYDGRPSTPSADMTGYTWASDAEVNELFMRYTPGGVGFDLAAEGVSEIYFQRGDLDPFFEDISYTYGNGLNISGAFGLTRDGHEISMRTDGAQHEYDNPYSEKSYPDHIERIAYELPDDYWWEGLGGWFYQDVAVETPEPGTIGLIAVGLMALRVARSRGAAA